MVGRRRTRSGPRPGRGSRRTSRRGAAVGRHRARASRCTSSGSGCCSTHRWAVVSWPAEYGGRDASLWEWLIFEEEYYRAGGPQRVTQNGIFLLAPTVFEFGTPEQQDRILPRMAAAEDLWCQGWSEPGAGQRPRRASRAGPTASTAGGCSTGRRRGRPAARSARTCSGCSAPTRRPNGTRGSRTSSCRSTAPGVTVRGFGRLDGDEGFAEVFFDDVVRRPTTPSSAGSTTGGASRWRRPGRSGASRCGRRAVPGHGRAAARRYRSSERAIGARRRRRRVDAGRGVPAVHAGDGDPAGRRASSRGPSRASTSCGGPSSTSTCTRSRSTCSAPTPSSRDRGRRAGSSRWPGPIYAGTNEIQRNIAAERVLGLPRR